MNRPTAVLLFALAQLAWGPAAHAGSLDLQERCKSDASRTFQELEDENNAKYDPSTLVRRPVSDHQNHYNAKLDRCLLLIQRRAVLPLATNLSNQMRQSILIDANERRTYALYVETQLAEETKSKIEKCELRPGMRLKMACTTRGQFDAFVATYLEE
jgi:hypothetical protein